MPSRREEIERQIHNLDRRINTVQGWTEHYTKDKASLEAQRVKLLDELKTEE